MTAPESLGPRTTDMVETLLRSLVDERVVSSRDIHESYHRLWQTIRAVVASGGKRIRPQLTMVGYGSFNEAIVPVAAAQELIHIAMLMHDDVIDRDTVRHGKLNVNGTYAARYQPYLDETDATHYGYSAGILAGDLLISEAYQLIATANLEPSIKQAVSARLGLSIFEVVGGELLDVEAAFMHDQLLDPLTVARYKTASYTFMGPLLSGALCHNASEQTLAALESYASNAGIAFQIQDDLLGVFGDEAVIGKSTLGDLREAKATLLIDHYKATLEDSEETQFTAVFGNADASNEQFEQLKTLISQSGAKQKTERAVRDYYERALEALKDISNTNQRAWLEQFTASLMERVA